MFREPR